LTFFFIIGLQHHPTMLASIYFVEGREKFTAYDQGADGARMRQQLVEFKGHISISRQLIVPISTFGTPQPPQPALDSGAKPR
jgi:hypothetical protein